MIRIHAQRGPRQLGAVLRVIPAWLLFAAVAGCGGGADDDRARDGGTDGPTAIDWSTDDRLRALLATDCGRRGTFDRDTTETTRVLVQRLADGQRDVLRYGKEQLAKLGDEMLDPLGEALARWSEDEFAIGPLCNGLGVLRMTEAEGARELLLRYVVHPSVDVRVAAARGLCEHAQEDDYPLLYDLLGSVHASEASTRKVLLTALAEADPARFQRDLGRWMRDEVYPGLWSPGIDLALQDVDARTAGRFLGVDANAFGPGLRPKVLALQAAGGDEAALEALRTALLEGELPARSAALLSLPAIGREEWAVEVLASDTIPAERARAAAVLGPIADRDVARDALHVALNDPAREVRLAALTALVSVGDPRAADRALTLLDGRLADIELASLALRDHWDANPGLADRARDRLLTRIERDQSEFLRIKARLQALGLVPGVESAQALMALVDEFEDREVQGLDLHRWLTGAAGNAGPEARAWLGERWRSETDPRRRMDLLEAAGGGRDETSRAFLLALVQGDRATEAERLFAASLLVRLGPAAELAPLLKRVALRLEGAETRQAFECLLWTWYG